MQAADPQYGLISLFANGSLDDWSQERAITQRAVREWNALDPRPKFVAICGDLVNEMPTGNKTRRRLQLDDLRADLSALDPAIPLVLLGGNHDFANTPTADTVKEYVAEFGDDYYVLYKGGVMFIALNSQFYKNHSLVPELYEQQNEWLEEQLSRAVNGSYQHIVVMQHIPWFLKSIDEPVDQMFTIELDERTRMVNELYDAGVRYIFAGHYHRNRDGLYRHLEMVTTSALGAQSFEGQNADSGYRVVSVDETRINHAYVNVNMTTV